MEEGEVMGEQMTFPKTFDEFAEQYKIVDKEQVYTNGTELIPIFRVKQWLGYIPAADVVETEILKEHLRNLTGMFTDELGFVLSLNVVLDAIDFVREKRKEGGAE